MTAKEKQELLENLIIGGIKIIYLLFIHLLVVTIISLCDQMINDFYHRKFFDMVFVLKYHTNAFILYGFIFIAYKYLTTDDSNKPKKQ